jgi:hypothetical protein
MYVDDFNENENATATAGVRLDFDGSLASANVSMLSFKNFTSEFRQVPKRKIVLAA